MGVAFQAGPRRWVRFEKDMVAGAISIRVAGIGFVPAFFAIRNRRVAPLAPSECSSPNQALSELEEPSG
jgi:hypothetical protein